MFPRTLTLGLSLIDTKPKTSQFSAGLWSMTVAGQLLSRNEGLPRGMETLFTAFHGESGL